MSLILFYDTETTGLVDFKAKSNADHQPHIVQIAGTLIDYESRKTVASIDVVIKPDGWEIPSEVSKIHGITTEYANDVGIPEKLALAAFMHLWSGRLRVAHNEQFDARIMRIAQSRFGYSENQIDQWKNGVSECTQILSTPIVKAPPTERMIAAGRNHYKSANLREAHSHFMGFEFENAHSAIADVNACIAVYFAIKGLGECDGR